MPHSHVATRLCYAITDSGCGIISDSLLCHCVYKPNSTFINAKTISAVITFYKKQRKSCVVSVYMTLFLQVCLLIKGNTMCQTFNFNIIQIFLICLRQIYLHTVSRIQKKHLYTSLPTGFPVWCHILHSTGKTWQNSQQPQPPGADSANVPTQEFWTSDRKQAQLSQGRYKSASPLTPSLPLIPKKWLLGPLVLLLSDKPSLPQYIFNPSSAQHPLVSCFSLKATK